VAVFSMQDEKNEKTEWSKYFIGPIDFSRHEGLRRDLQKAEHFLYSNEAAQKLEKLIIDFRPEIAHLHNISHQLTPSILFILKKHEIPIVQTLHDYALICPNYRLYARGAVCERCYRHKYYEAALNRCVRNSIFASILSAKELALHKLIHSYDRVDAFIAPSRFIARTMKRWGIKNKIFQLSNFVDEQEFSPAGERGDYGLFVGRLEPEKGIKILLEALKAKRKINFKIIGDGSLLNWGRDFARENKMDEVEFLGYKTKAEVKRYLTAARFLVIPSQWYENNPITILEAMACGVPVIGANIGGISELIQDRKTGYLFKYQSKDELAKKIGYLYDHAAIAGKMGSLGRQIAEKEYNGESHYKRLMKIYKTVIRD